MFDDLLAALSRKDDVRDLFQHLTAVICRIVPHDEAQLMLSGEMGPHIYTPERPIARRKESPADGTVAMLDSDRATGARCRARTRSWPADAA